jgi:hypothetical protein
MIEREPYELLRLSSQGGLLPPSSHRTVRVLFTYGSSGQRISSNRSPTAAGRVTTSSYPSARDN